MEDTNNSSLSSGKERRKVHMEKPRKTVSPTRKSSIVLRNELLLHEACIKNNVVAVKRLLDAKVDVNSRSHMNRTPLHWSVTYNHPKIIDLLIKAKCDLEATDKFGMKAILMAASLGHKEALQRLIKAGANVHAANKHGRGLLHCAVECNQLELLNFVFESLENFNLNVVDKNSQAAIHLAVDRGLTEAADSLINAGCDLAVKDKQGQTPLHLAVKNSNITMLTKLLKKGVEINEPDLERNTALHLAAETGNNELVTLLLNHQANVNLKNLKGNSPLHVAICNNQEETAKMLISKQVDINAKNQKLQTPLHIASEHGHLDIVECLLLAGADVTVKDKSGKVALAMAARGSFISIVDTIIKVERFKNHQNSTNETSIQLTDVQKFNELQTDVKYENIRQILWRLATKQLKPYEWKKLASHWKFSQEQIRAIEHQYTGQSSYKEHGYRMLLIWLSGLEQDRNVIKEVYEALVSIGRKDAAESMRQKAEKQHIPESPPKRICQQCSVA